MTKYNDLSEKLKEKAIIKNAHFFEEQYGIPEGQKPMHFRTKSFVDDFLSSNNFELGEHLEVILR